MTDDERRRARRRDAAIALGALPFEPAPQPGWTVAPRDRDVPEPWAPERIEVADRTAAGYETANG